LVEPNTQIYAVDKDNVNFILEPQYLFHLTFTADKKVETNCVSHGAIKIIKRTVTILKL
jgi:hypothetical protein